jgi:hypothetical protein
MTYVAPKLRPTDGETDGVRLCSHFVWLFFRQTEGQQRLRWRLYSCWNLSTSKSTYFVAKPYLTSKRFDWPVYITNYALKRRQCRSVYCKLACSTKHYSQIQQGCATLLGYSLYEKLRIAAIAATGIHSFRHHPWNRRSTNLTFVNEDDSQKFHVSSKLTNSPVSLLLSGLVLKTATHIRLYAPNLNLAPASDYWDSRDALCWSKLDGNLCSARTSMEIIKSYC